MLVDKIQDKKKQKKERLEQAAYDLFSEQGFSETSIDQIARRAGVAKGTFYLYFPDKEALLNQVIFKCSSRIFKEAMQESRFKQLDDWVERVIVLIDYVIELFKERPNGLKVINKNLSWSMVGDQVAKGSSEGVDQEFAELLSYYLEQLEGRGYDRKAAFQLIFMVVELVGAVCYSSLVLGQLGPIDELKPMLFETVRKMIRN